MYSESIRTPIHFKQLKDLKLLSLFLSVLLQTQLRPRGEEPGPGKLPVVSAGAMQLPSTHASPQAATLALAQGLVMTTEGLPVRGSSASPAPSPLPRPAQAGQWAAGRLRTFSDRGYQAGTLICTPFSALLVSTVEQWTSQSPYLGWPPL